MFASRKPGAAVGVARLSIDAWLERLLVFVAAASLAGIGLGLVGAFVAPLVLAVAIVVSWI
jgi:hypothetical protein